MSAGLEERASLRIYKPIANFHPIARGVRTETVDLPWSSDRQEQHSLQFFVKHSAPQLAGYFDSPFWQRMVLQAGRQEPAVRHAIAAIGALHEKLLTGAVNPEQSQDQRTRFALEQCNKSIQHLVSPADKSTKPDLRLMLTTCVLFTCFEALQGHCEQAIIHATQGYSLLQQYATVCIKPWKNWTAGLVQLSIIRESKLTTTDSRTRTITDGTLVRSPLNSISFAF